MEFNMERVRIGVGEYSDTQSAFYDITDVLGIKLPDYISRIEIGFADIIVKGEDEKEENLKEKFEEHMKDGFALLGSSIRNDTRMVFVTFRDGYIMKAWNSEWGGLTIEPPVEGLDNE